MTPKPDIVLPISVSQFLQILLTIVALNLEQPSNYAERNPLPPQKAASNMARVPSQSTAPKLSIDDGLVWKSKRKAMRKSDFRKSLPHAELLTELENRDHVRNAFICESNCAY